MKKAEAIRWIKQRIAQEVRITLAEVPDSVNDSPDPDLIASLWSETTWDIAERIWPEDKPA